MLYLVIISIVEVEVEKNLKYYFMVFVFFLLSFIVEFLIRYFIWKFNLLFFSICCFKTFYYFFDYLNLLILMKMYNFSVNYFKRGIEFCIKIRYFILVCEVWGIMLIILKRRCEDDGESGMIERGEKVLF